MYEVIKQPLKVWLQCAGVVILSAIFPIVFLFCNNADQVSIGEVWKPILLFGGVAFGIFIVLLLILRNLYSAALSTVALAILFLNYTLIENAINFVFPALRYWHIAPILLFIWFHIAFVSYIWRDKELIQTILMVIGITFAGLSIFNIVMGAPKMVDNYTVEQNIKQAKYAAVNTSVQSTNMPNVYFFIFDEYASFKQMEKYYNYDNKVFKQYLNTNKFTVSYDSYNEISMTSVVAANLVSLEYVADTKMQESDREMLRANGKLFEIFRNQGYQIRAGGDALYYGMDSVVENQKDFAKTISGESFVDLISKQTPMRPFYMVEKTEKLQSILKNFEYFGEKENIPKTSTFTIAHIVFPHQPFLVDQNGFAVPEYYWSDWNDDSYYKGQYIYCTKLMMKMLDNIIENDPDSVIILQSDHGARASSNLRIYDTKFTNEDRTRILNAVYFQGKPIEQIINKSGVNTLRLVLNRLFDMNMEEVEIPYYEHS